jgi:hypothetical protein
VLGEGSFNGTDVPIELVTYESGRIEIGAHTFINYGTSIAAPASARIGSHCHPGHYMFVMENDKHDVVRHWESPPSESGCHRWQRLDRLKSGHPSRRPHWQPRRIRCTQNRYQGYSSAMCRREISCARASSPHGTRLAHVLVFGLPIVTRWAEKFRSDRGGEPLVALIARIQ